MRHEKSCGAVIFRSIGGKWHVLLIRHEKGHHVAFPKGHVELGETEVQTAEREVLEDTGLRVKVDEEDPIQESPRRHRPPSRTPGCPMAEYPWVACRSARRSAVSP